MREHRAASGYATTPRGSGLSASASGLPNRRLRQRKFPFSCIQYGCESSILFSILLLKIRKEETKGGLQQKKGEVEQFFLSLVSTPLAR